MALGGLIFILYAIFDDSPPPVAENLLVVTDADAERLVTEFEATWRRKPVVEELDFMIAERVREEVYVREAIALGLDRDDAVIRRRLQLKMEVLTESGAELVAPEDTVLEAHLAAHPERFSTPPLLAFEQVLLLDTLSAEDVKLALADLNAGGRATASTRPTMLPPVVAKPSPARAIDGTFGTGFFDAITDLPQGGWAGPVETTFGLHLVRITRRTDARLPTIAEVRAEVEADWRADVTRKLREDRYEALRSRYEVVVPSAATVLAP